MTIIDPMEFANGAWNRRYVAFDTETTGLDCSIHRIVQIGAIRVSDGVIEGRFTQLVQPLGGSMSEDAQAVTGITDAMLMGMPAIENVLPDFLRFANGLPLVAHNAPFDAGFIQAEACRYGLNAQGLEYVDTLQLAKATWTREQVQNYKLTTLAAHVGHTMQMSHRAVDDAEAVNAVLLAAARKIYGGGEAGDLGSKILDFIRGQGMVNRQMVYSSVRASKNRIDTAIQTLINAGAITCIGDSLLARV